MITAILIFVVLALAGAYALERRSGGRVVVTTVRGESIRGTRRIGLFSVRLADAEALRSSGEPAALAGRVEIRRRSVAMIQHLPTVPQKRPELSEKFALPEPTSR